MSARTDPKHSILIRIRSVCNLRSYLRHCSASNLPYKVSIRLPSFLPSYLHVFQKLGKWPPRTQEAEHEWLSLLLSRVALTTQMLSTSNTKDSASPDDVLRSPKTPSNPDMRALRFACFQSSQKLTLGVCVAYKVPTRLSFFLFLNVHVLQNVEGRFQKFDLLHKWSFLLLSRPPSTRTGAILLYH